MTHIRQILANLSISVSEFKKDPKSVIKAVKSEPIAVIMDNKPAFYCVPADILESLYSKVYEFNEFNNDAHFRTEALNSGLNDDGSFGVKDVFQSIEDDQAEHISEPNIVVDPINSHIADPLDEEVANQLNKSMDMHMMDKGEDSFHDDLPALDPDFLIDPIDDSNADDKGHAQGSCPNCLDDDKAKSSKNAKSNTKNAKGKRAKQNAKDHGASSNNSSASSSASKADSKTSPVTSNSNSQSQSKAKTQAQANDQGASKAHEEHSLSSQSSNSSSQSSEERTKKLISNINENSKLDDIMAMHDAMFDTSNDVSSRVTDPKVRELMSNQNNFDLAALERSFSPDDDNKSASDSNESIFSLPSLKEQLKAKSRAKDKKAHKSNASKGKKAKDKKSKAAKK